MAGRDPPVLGFELNQSTNNKQRQKYLRTRAITAPWQLNGSARADFRAAVVIPALTESQSLPQTLASLATNPAEALKQTLIAIVTNNRVDVSADRLQDNQQTLAWLQAKPFPQLNLAWVDASSAGLELPAKEGVGLARKIGFDLSLSFLDWTKQPLLISLDADTLVDQNYLPVIFEHFRRSQKGGVVVPFRHQSALCSQQEAAIRHYELYLRSYVFGLQQAGSPYVYHSIGSTIACRAAAYVNAGGMNRRRAAEDFYFLQQLAKTSGVESLVGTIVRPSPRFSDRVPFGTGKAVRGQVEEGRQLFKFISVDSFKLLRAWFGLVEKAWNLSAENLLQRAAGISSVLYVFLLQLDFPTVWGRLQRNYATEQQRLAAFHLWFDGLRTRQLLTQVEADKDSSVDERVAELLEWGGFSVGSDCSEQLALLESLQGVK
ncbi:MAG: hypothetical protein KAT62_12945 [Desulfuromonadales bacterium]|nr:hypothetical protein [Desulfuromonadales bacterium]